MKNLYRVVMLSLSIFSLLALSGLAQPTAQKPAPEQVIWTGASGGYTVRWTTGDVVAYPTANAADVRLSAKQLARAEFGKIEKDSEDQDVCEFERTFRVVSLVGSVLTLETTYYLGCGGAHPDGNARFVAIDLAKPRAAKTRGLTDDESLPANLATLTDYFPEAEILRALLADSLIQKALEGKRPKTLAALLKICAEDFPTVAQDEKLCFTVERDLLTRFAFHHLENGKIAVRLGLSGTAVCRNNLTQIGILLPVPDALKQPLALAEAGTEGFMMNRKLGTGRETKFDFSKKKKSAR
jgi:hypothetical protein